MLILGSRYIAPKRLKLTIPSFENTSLNLLIMQYYKAGSNEQIYSILAGDYDSDELIQDIDPNVDPDDIIELSQEDLTLENSTIINLHGTF